MALAAPACSTGKAGMSCRCCIVTPTLLGSSSSSTNRGRSLVHSSCLQTWEHSVLSRTEEQAGVPMAHSQGGQKSEGSVQNLHPRSGSPACSACCMTAELAA